MVIYVERGREGKGLLVVPPLVEDARDALYPFIHFSGLVPGSPAIRRAGRAVFAESETRLYARIDWLRPS